MIVSGRVVSSCASHSPSFQDYREFSNRALSLLYFPLLETVTTYCSKHLTSTYQEVVIKIRNISIFGVNKVILKV